MSVELGLVRDVGSEYLLSVLDKYARPTDAVRVAEEMFPVIREWAGKSLVDISLSGSYAKETATALGTDVDVFISLGEAGSSFGGRSIKDIYWGLFHWLTHRGLRPRAGNVSLRVEIDEIAVDLVPAQLRSGCVCESHALKNAGGGTPSEIRTRDHTLYWKKKDSWVQTNVAEHIRVVTGSGRAREIRALKIWRERQRLDFSSFYLEVTVLDALRGRRTHELGDNVRRVLHYLADEFVHARAVDPANSNNVISDDYGPEEKRRIAMAARKTLQMSRLEQALW
jgi:hypothetical protein